MNTPTAFQNFCTIAFACALYVTTLPVSAQTISIPLSELVGPPGTTNSPDTTINRYLANQLKTQFDALGLNTNIALVVGDVQLDKFDKTLATVCPVPLPKQAHIDAAVAHITFDTTSGLAIDIPALQNITVTAHLTGRIDTQAPAQVTWGQAIPFIGNCENVWTENGTIAVTLPFALDLTANVSLEPSYDEQQVAIIVNKNAALSGSVSFGTGNIDTKFGSNSPAASIINAFEDYLLNALTTSAEKKLAQKLAALNNRLNGLDANGNPDPLIEAFNQPSVFVIEDNPQNQETVRALLRELDIPEFVTQLMANKGAEILLRLATMNDSDRKKYLAELGAGIGCDALLLKYELPLPQSPLYVKNDTTCDSADLYGTDAGQYYLDNTCTQEVAFRPTSPATFCAERTGTREKVELGNAAWVPDVAQASDPLPQIPSKKWTSLSSTRLGIGVVTAPDTPQPFVKQFRYKTISDVPRGNGICQLEMRVYKNDIAATNLKPMLAIHGGTWSGRGFSVLGLEASVRMFTAQGFAVFVPFYRLVGDADGNVECNRASWREITADMQDALRWVIQNGPALGTSTDKVTLFGQSAGGHLAAWLATHEAAMVRKSLLFYPALDLVDFLQGAVPLDGRYASFRGFGLKSIANLYGSGNGTTEIRLAEIDSGAINPALLTDGIVAHIPDRVFNLAGVDRVDPPRYLARCATLTATDLATLDLLNPPAALLSCLKQDLSEFLVENSFNHQINANVAPIFIAHGTGDTLVPYAQTINLCNARDGGARPLDVPDPGIMYRCGAYDEVHVISGAQHTLDLGICIGTLCPAGAPASSTRNEVFTTLTTAYQWAGTDSTQTSNTAPNITARVAGGTSGGGALDRLTAMITVIVSWIKWISKYNSSGSSKESHRIVDVWPYA